MENKNNKTPIEQANELQKLLAEYARTLTQQHKSKTTGPTLHAASDIGQIIREARKTQDLTQHELANLAELSIGTIVQIEKDHKRVAFENIERVLNILGKSIWIK